MPQDRQGPFLGDPVPLLHASRRIQILNSNGRCGCLGLAVCLRGRLSYTKTKSQGDKFQSQAANKGRREDQGATGGADGGRRPEVPTEVADGAACADGGRRRSGARRRKSPTGEGVLSPRALTWIHPSTGRFQLVRPIPNREEPGCWSYRYALGGCTGIREPGTPI